MASLPRKHAALRKHARQQHTSLIRPHDTSRVDTTDNLSRQIVRIIQHLASFDRTARYNGLYLMGQGPYSSCADMAHLCDTIGCPSIRTRLQNEWCPATCGTCTAGDTGAAGGGGGNGGSASIPPVGGVPSPDGYTGEHNAKRQMHCDTPVVTRARTNRDLSTRQLR